MTQAEYRIKPETRRDFLQLTSERGCVVLDQPQRSRIATPAGVGRRSSPVNALRLVEDGSEDSTMK